MGYSRAISPVQLGGPFHFCDWIGLAAITIRLSDQPRMKCTLPRQRLCVCSYTQLSKVCQGADCTKASLSDSCNKREGSMLETQRAAPLRVSGPYRPIQLTHVQCRLAFCHSLRHDLQSKMSALQVWASRVRFNLTLIPERFAPQKLTQCEQLSLWPSVYRNKQPGHPSILRSCPGRQRHTGRLATKPCCLAVRAAVA